MLCPKGIAPSACGLQLELTGLAGPSAGALVSVLKLVQCAMVEFDIMEEDKVLEHGA